MTWAPGSYESLQRQLIASLGETGASDIEAGTIVVVPSLSFPTEELRKITGITYYEERMLFVLLFLARPGIRVVFATSLPVEQPIIDYYLRFLPDPADARRRLTLIDAGDPDPSSLAAKIMRSPGLIERIRKASVDERGGYLLTFNVSEDECALSERISVPLYGPRLDLVPLGSKSGSRKTAHKAGVPVLEGAEDLSSVREVVEAIAEMRSRRPTLKAVVVKLNNGFSGQGNAIVHVGDGRQTCDDFNTSFCATGETWASFGPKIAAEGAIVEELLQAPNVTSPSVQVRIRPSGLYEIVSTHDQVLAAPDNQVYLGCRFPARSEYRSLISSYALSVADVLSSHGVIGSFGIDFLVSEIGGEYDVYLSEINLRLGGTTHPYWMARLVLGAQYSAQSGNLVAKDTHKAYVASDNFKSEHYVGRHPARLIEMLDERGLGYNDDVKIGTTLHLLGALHHYGKFGATCIADSLEDADRFFAQVAEVAAE